MTHYTTWGPVRGDCGHLHTTEVAAEQCRDRDGRGCARRGGYSDRMVRRIDAPSRAEARAVLSGYDVTAGPGRRV